MASYFYIPVTIFAAYLVCHIIKEIIHVTREGKFSLYTLFFETGGMPSSHSAGVSALTMAVLLQEGVTALFWVSFVFGAVVIRDAFGVRKSVSDQAELLNALTSHMEFDKKVDIVLGHTPIQVAVGMTIGIVLASGLWLLF